MKFDLLNNSDTRRKKATSLISRDQKSKFGQFFTPASIAKILASQFHNLEGDIRLLDPGAGVGILTAAVVERILQNPGQVRSCFLTAYEVDPNLVSFLAQTLDECCRALQYFNISAEYQVENIDYIKTSVDSLMTPLYSMTPMTFTHAILNPPYKKINSNSYERRLLSSAGIETGNLYSAFVWITMKKLVLNGEMVAITPRSFFNGPYFKLFRYSLINTMAIDTIHVFESRQEAFSDDEVLQENVIFHAKKNTTKSELVRIESSIGNGHDGVQVARYVPFSQVVNPGDREFFIHLTLDESDEWVKNQMEAFPCSLDDLGLNISTGPVVDFRLREFVATEELPGTVPLIYPEAIRNGKVNIPPVNSRKPIAIMRNKATEKWLTKNGWYVLVRRFSSKEEKRRIVAVCFSPTKYQKFGIENHLNYFHAHGNGIDEYLAKGLTAFLNSTLFDNYFRQFSGHTQVNAMDLQKISYPCKEDLIMLGKTMGSHLPPQAELDSRIEETLQKNESNHPRPSGQPTYSGSIINPQ